MNAAPLAHDAPPAAVPGPHICNQVGKNVLGLVKALISERCDANGGSLAKADIARILDQLASSSHLFPVYDAAYTGCDHTRRGFRGGAFNADTLPRFIVIALLRDAMQAAFHSPAQSHDHNWQSTFAAALIGWLEETQQIAVSERLMAEYRQAAARRGATLVPGDLLCAAPVIALAADVVAALKRVQASGPAALAAMETAINETIALALQVAGPSPKKINSHSLSLFLDAVTQPGGHNRFRAAALAHAS